MLQAMRPKFEDLWNGYPADASADDGIDHWPCLKLTGEPMYENQCAIRVSIALAAAGVNMKSCPKAKCDYNKSYKDHAGHVIRAQELADWLKNHLLGAPQTWTVDKHGKKPIPGTLAQVAVQGQTGIVFFKDFWAREGERTATGDHIDLWNETTGKTINLGLENPDDNYFPRSKEVWFWRLT